MLRLQVLCKELIVDKSRLAEARPVVEQLLALTLKLRGEEHQDMVLVLHWVGFLSQQAGDSAGAERAWNRSLAIQEKLPVKDPVWFTRALHMLAGLYKDQADFPKAEQALKQVLELREKALGPEHPETAMVVRTLGRLYKSMGNYALAESFLRRALAIFEKSSHENATTAETLGMLGSFYADLGDLENAEALVARGLAMQERLFGAEHIHTLNSTALLAEIHLNQARLQDAEPLFRRNLEIREKLNGPDSPTLTWPLRQLINICMDRKRFPEAGQWLQRLASVFEKSYGPDHPDRAGLFELRAELAEERGDFPRALEDFTQAFLICEKHLGPDHHSTMVYRRDMARLHFLLGQAGPALACADAIQTVEERRLAEVLSFTAEQQRLTYHRRFLDGHSINLWATMGAVQPLARALLRTKGVVLDSLLEDRILAEASSDPETQQQIHELSRLRLRLTQSFFDERSRHNEASVSSAQASPAEQPPALQIEKLQAALARKVAGLGAARRALETRLDPVQKAIPPGSALIEFLRYEHCDGKGESDDRYGALVIGGQGEPKWVWLGNADALEKNIRLYQHLVRSPLDSGSLEPLLRELGRQIWTPIARALPARTCQVFLCPDSQLNFLSFATLMISSNRFLAEEYAVSYVSNARDLLVENFQKPASKRLLVWANPDFGATIGGLAGVGFHAGHESTPPRSLRGLDLRALPGTERESRLLQKRAADLGFDEAVIHLGRDATERELRRVQSPDVLHLATHGFMLPDQDEALSRNRSSAKLREPLNNPMLRTGLALAGARRTLKAWSEGRSVPADNDGIVTAEEISSLHLQGTRLVVLSACDTGIGEARAGEGVLGLRRGFIQAGAQNLLLTLWPIDDEQTAGLMLELYSAARRSGDFTVALAQVQHAWLRRLRTEKGAAEACRIAGPFILSFQGRPGVPDSN